MCVNDYSGWSATDLAQTITYRVNSATQLTFSFAAKGSANQVLSCSSSAASSCMPCTAAYPGYLATYTFVPPDCTTINSAGCLSCNYLQCFTCDEKNGYILASNGQCVLGCGCPGHHQCINGHCIGTGRDHVTINWDIYGDLDLYLTFPDGTTTVYQGNPGPFTTGQNMNAVMDATSITYGPENIYWPDALPLAGAYLVCVDTPGWALNPGPYTVTYSWPGLAAPATKVISMDSSSSAPNPCTATAVNYLGTFSI